MRRIVGRALMTWRDRVGALSPTKMQQVSKSQATLTTWADVPAAVLDGLWPCP